MKVNANYRYVVFWKTSLVSFNILSVQYFAIVEKI